MNTVTCTWCEDPRPHAWSMCASCFCMRPGILTGGVELRHFIEHVGCSQKAQALHTWAPSWFRFVTNAFSSLSAKRKARDQRVALRWARFLFRLLGAPGPLGPLGSSSTQHRRTPELVQRKGQASFRITSSPHKVSGLGTRWSHWPGSLVRPGGLSARTKLSTRCTIWLQHSPPDFVSLCRPSLARHSSSLACSPHGAPFPFISSTRASALES